MISLPYVNSFSLREDLSHCQEDARSVCRTLDEGQLHVVMILPEAKEMSRTVWLAAQSGYRMAWATQRRAQDTMRHPLASLSDTLMQSPATHRPWAATPFLMGDTSKSGRSGSCPSREDGFFYKSCQTRRDHWTNSGHFELIGPLLAQHNRTLAPILHYVNGATIISKHGWL